MAGKKPQFAGVQHRFQSHEHMDREEKPDLRSEEHPLRLRAVLYKSVLESSISSIFVALQLIKTIAYDE
jgi:hypothetical protein